MSSPASIREVERAAARIPLVVFRLETHHYALQLQLVERVLPMMALTPLPGVPAIVLGALMLEGRVVPVLDMRGRFGLPRRSPQLTDRLIVANTGRRDVALAVDDVVGTIERARAEIVPAAAVLPGLQQIEGLVGFADGLLLIQNLHRFLSLEEDAQIASAVGAGR